ncbi:class III poly(R)-hydroxyalkanoic acid synthase subunit PhaE [Luteimonas kalidii]|uniref:Poly(3-hydroxyalkanoate) polymerase subunit PhaE n=1 Tax=Luteimonas kalidii TaxID=3042025 RepID=A0ABT6JUF3_9GAMM|nr:class III poly(R)-hydroxyalkanoic acid synthase subunit PhaE [Luteimonas kalidii]MDH5834105.1 class III poly(R)-hydroxyalkanoic acid synthase subunit PhaE [Luteimonas kalidii]
MFNQGFGAGPGQGQDFERLARQYWAAWGDALRGAAPGAGQPGMHAWQDAIDWWTRYAHGGRSGVNEALERFNVQARDWYGHMQQVAAQFAGRDHSAGDIAHAWKQALGAAGANPFPEMLRSLRGHGLPGPDQWVEDASPWLEAARGEGMSWLRLPAFGAGREHQERLQRLAQSAMEYEQASSGYNALMLKASQDAFRIFEDRLAAHEEPGRQIETPRALFDLWIDAAEEAYAEIALSPEFRHAYAQLVDAQMRLRAGVQREVEQACTTLGMPTRTEVDAAHRKIVELERAMRRLRDAADGGPAPAAPRTARERAQAKAGRGAARAQAGSAASANVPEAGEAQKAQPDATTQAPTGKAARRGTSAAGGKPKASKRATGARADSARAARRPARKVASRPAVSARRSPTNGFSSHIPIPDAPLPPDPTPDDGQEGA